MKLAYRLIPIILATFAFAVYLYTAAPSSVWLDAGRIAAGVVSWGITDPADPSYHPLAHLFTLLPIGSIIFRLQIFAALMAAVTLVLIYRLTLQLLAKENDRLFKTLAAVVSMLTLAFCYQFWSQAQNIEVFIMVGLLEAIILSLILWPTQSKEQFMRKMAGIVIAFGIASGTNPIIMSVMPSALLLMAQKRKLFKDTSLIGLALLGLTIVVLIYSYIPIRAQAHPFLNWYYVRHLDDLMVLATGSDLNIYVPELERVNGFTGSPQVFIKSATNYLEMLVQSFTIWLVPFMLMGAWRLWRSKERFAFWILGLVVGTNFVFSGLYKSGNQESWFIVSYVVLAVFIGQGFYQVSRWLEKIRDGRKVAMALTLVALLPLITLWPITNRHQWHLSDDYVHNLYRPVEPPAIIYGSGDNYDSLSYYAYEVLKPNHNVIPLTDNLFFLYQWYRDNLRVNTDLKFPKEPDPSADPTIEYNRFLNEFIALNIPKYKIYLTQVAMRNRLSVSPDGKGTLKLDSRFKTVPQGLLMQVVPKEATTSPNLAFFDFDFHNSGYPAKKPVYLEEVYTGELRGMTNEYGFSMYSVAEWLFKNGQKDQAQKYYEKSQEFSPGNQEILESWNELLNPESTKSAKLKAPTGFQTYQNEQTGLAFNYPNTWWVEDIQGGLRINETSDEFKVEIKQDKKDKGETDDHFVSNYKITYGSMQNVGPAKLNKWDNAQVKVWLDGKINRLQFFLFKGDKVVLVTVWPSNSKQMKAFDTIIDSLQLL